MTTNTDDYTRTLTVPIETNLVTITAVPDGVFISLSLESQSGELMPAQARQVAALLTQAAEDAEHIDFADDDPDNIDLRDDRV